MCTTSTKNIEKYFITIVCKFYVFIDNIDFMNMFFKKNFKIMHLS